MPHTRSLGYTLVELMIASAIAVIILGGVGTSFAVAMRMMNQAIAETEFALATRELRDKLLFHLAPNEPDFHPAGLWSMTNSASVIEGNAKIKATATVVGRACLDETTQYAQLLLGEYRGGWGFCDDSNRANTRWLRPASLPLASDFSQTVWVSEYGTDRRNQTYARRYHLNLTYHYHPSYLPESVTTFDISRTESIVVPLMGKIQTKAFAYGKTEADL